MRHGRYERRAPAANHGRHAKKRKLNKSILVTLSLLLVLSLATGGTIAYLLVNGSQVTNTFTPGYVACQVNSDHSIKNTSNVDTYIRAAVVVNWVDNSGNLYAIAPEYAATTNSIDGWYKQGDYYYYIGNGKPAISPNTVINAPVDVAITSTNPDADTYHLEIDIIAEAIQADGKKDSDGVLAVIDAWGVAIPNIRN